MYVVIWRFRPLTGREHEFERAYGPSGEWTRLFQHGEGYLGTELLQSSDDRSSGASQGARAPQQGLVRRHEGQGSSPSEL
jgi:hypothetical protein